jgi:hypothetical protein
MKQFYLTLLVIILTLSILTESKRTKFKRHHTRHYTNEEYARMYARFAQLPYCTINELTERSCQLCKNLEAEGNITIEQAIKKDIRPNIALHMVTSIKDGEYIISFAGPKSSIPSDLQYIQNIYRMGQSKIPDLGGKLVENEFWSAYRMIQDDLREKVQRFKESQYLSFKLVGHSFGGAIALLAAYDLVLSGRIEAERVHVITYAALKIGDQSIDQIIEKTSNPIRVAQEADPYNNPTCVYMPNINSFYCYKRQMITYLVQQVPRLVNYFYFMCAADPVIHNVLIQYRPQIVQIQAPVYHQAVIANSSENIHFTSEDNAESQEASTNGDTTDTNDAVGQSAGDSIGTANFNSHLVHHTETPPEMPSVDVPEDDRVNDDDGPTDSEEPADPEEPEDEEVAGVQMLEKKHNVMVDEVSPYTHTCEDHGGRFYICKADPDIHTNFYGYNLEECE